MPLNAISGWIIVACWIGFVVFWLVSARRAKANARTSYLNWVFRAVIVIAAIIMRSRFGGIARLPVAHLPHPVLGAAGVVLCLCGLALAIWARICLGRNWGMPMSLKKDPELVTTGPYAYVRHPIYTGILLMMLGSASAFNLLWLVVVAILAAYFLYSAVQEQKIMLREFPDTYPAYMARTKMLIPFVF